MIDTTLLEFLVLMTFVLVGPLVPTIVIFKVFPDSRINWGGPFKGMTLKATGAIAGYLVVGVLLFKYTDAAVQEIKRKARQSAAWQVKGRFQLVTRNEKGELVPVDNASSEQIFSNIQVTPRNCVIQGNALDLWLATNDLERASVVFSGYGIETKTIESAELGKALDDEAGTVHLDTILLVQNFPSQQPAFSPIGDLTAASHISQATAKSKADSLATVQPTNPLPQ